MLSVADNTILERAFTLTGEERKTAASSVTVNDKKGGFDELYKKHWRQIYNLCFQVTKNKQTAEHITVKVFVQFYEDWKKSGSQVESAAYVRNLAVSQLINHLS